MLQCTAGAGTVSGLRTGPQPALLTFVAFDKLTALHVKSFPELLLNETRRSVNFRACLQLTILISEDPMDAIAYQIRLMSPHSLSKLPMIAWQTSSLLRRSFSQLLMPLGRMDLQSVRLSISFHGMTQNSKSIFHMESLCQYWI